jgi:hypothetical protein
MGACEVVCWLASYASLALGMREVRDSRFLRWFVLNSFPTLFMRDSPLISLVASQSGDNVGACGDETVKIDSGVAGGSSGSSCCVGFACYMIYRNTYHVSWN